MNAFGIGKSVGLAVGVLIGLVICIFLFKYMNKDGKVKTKYDEMQEITRGKGYKYAFYTVIICEALMAIINPLNITIKIEGTALHFIPIFLGVIVHTCYCIWKDAYVGINTNMTHFVIISIIVSFINIGVSVMAFVEGNMIVDGVLQSQFVNLLCGLMFAIIAVELIIKKVVDKRLEAEE